MKAGGVVTAEYDVPPAEWYFAAEPQPRMPFAVLLEVALQPCGWLAAYVGSALTSPTDLSFRNLGGRGTLHEHVGADAGTLTTTVKLTRVSSSGGMIIQNYDFDVRRAGRPVYSGDTYFGFFAKAALANQVGIREERLLDLPADPRPFPTRPPYPDSMLRMADAITHLDVRGGPQGLGVAGGTARSIRPLGSSPPTSARIRCGPARSGWSRCSNS